MTTASEKITEVRDDPEKRIVWLILVGAVAGLVIIALAFRDR